MRDDVKFELPPHRLLNGLRPAAPLVARPFTSGISTLPMPPRSRFAYLPSGSTASMGTGGVKSIMLCFIKVIQIWPKELLRFFYKLLSQFHSSEMTEFLYAQDTHQMDLRKLEPYLTSRSLIVMILVVCVRKIVASVLIS